jgi:hypothetical protein
VEGSCEHVNKPSGSIKNLEILQYVTNWWLLKDSASRSWLLQTEEHKRSSSSNIDISTLSHYFAK